MLWVEGKLCHQVRVAFMPMPKLVSRLLNAVCTLVIGWSPMIRCSRHFTVEKKKAQKAEASYQSLSRVCGPPKYCIAVSVTFSTMEPRRRGSSWVGKGFPGEVRQNHEIWRVVLTDRERQVMQGELAGVKRIGPADFGNQISNIFCHIRVFNTCSVISMHFCWGRRMYT